MIFRSTTKWLLFGILILCTSVVSAQTKVVVSEEVTTDPDISYLFIEDVTIKAAADGTATTIAPEAGGEIFFKSVQQKKSNKAPSEDHNFVRTETAKFPTNDEDTFTGFGPDKKSTSYSYTDGLGRPILDVISQGSPTLNDIIGHYEYNTTTGQMDREYLHYTLDSDTPGQFQETASTQQSSFHSTANKVAHDTHPYTFTNYEDSPLNRVKDITGVGQDWHNANEKSTVRYKVHPGGDDVNRVRKWTLHDNGAGDTEPRSTANYGANQLTILESENEDGILTQQITDPRGLNIANRTWAGTKWNTTYQVYDDLGRLRVTIPPKAADILDPTVDQLNGLYFLYEYDERTRKIMQKSPGVGKLFYVYDQWNNLVLSQDAEQSLLNHYTFYKYDAFNRVIASGELTLNDNLTTIRANAASGTHRFENPANNTIGYTLNQSYPIVTLNDLNSIHFYDNYDFIVNNGLTGIMSYSDPSGFNNIQETDVLDLLTGSKVRIVGTTDFLHTVLYYDHDYRLIQSVTENHIGGTDRLTMELDFIGQVQKELSVHSSTYDNLTVLTEYEYDTNENPTRTYITLNGGDRILMNDLHYNELGQVIENNLHSVDGGDTFLQSLDYRYTTQGWIKSINNADLAIADNNDDDNDLFGAEYFYQEYEEDGSGTQSGRFDGTLKALQWNSDNLEDTPQKKQFSFNYDPINRLTQATYDLVDGAASDNQFNVNINEYDDNGNIGELERYGEDSANPIDQLDYAYDLNSNQLLKIDETAPAGTGGFEELNPGITQDYDYDENGNLENDLNKDLTTITYNYMQLVDQVSFNDNSYISYLYDAAGNRLAKTLFDADGNEVARVDYVGAIEYLNHEINFTYTESGRAYQQNGTYHFEYFITDHQGNNRVSFGILPGRFEYKTTIETGETTDFEYDVNIRTTAENHTPLGNESAALNALAAKMVGPGLVLDINAGDIIHMESWAKYNDGLWGTNSTTGIAAAVVAAFNSGGTLPAEASTALTSTLNGTAAGVFGTNANSNEPAAYLQYIFFDDTYTFHSAGFVGVSIDAYQSWTNLQLPEWTAPQNGHLYIYVANESDQDQNVFFDDIKVIHESTATELRVTQVNDYYPFGMLMSTTWRNDAYLDPGLLYQSSYADYDSITGTHDFQLRNYDAAIGRWWQTDPYEQYASPYLGMGNNPHIGIDPDGGYTWIFPILGAAIGNVGLNLFLGNIDDKEDAYRYAAIGAISFAISSSLSNGVRASLGDGGFWNGFAATFKKNGTLAESNVAAATQGFNNGLKVGFISGVSGGFSLGFGNSLANGKKLNQALKNGLISGLHFGVYTGLTTGISWGRIAQKNYNDFVTGEKREDLPVFDDIESAKDFSREILDTYEAGGKTHIFETDEGKFIVQASDPQHVGDRFKSRNPTVGKKWETNSIGQTSIKIKKGIQLHVNGRWRWVNGAFYAHGPQAKVRFEKFLFNNKYMKGGGSLLFGPIKLF